MSLAPGTRLAHYEIGVSLGEGGMGQVFRARDTRLGRDVAIKVLPPSLAADADRLARFEREARLLASLNHPNIGAIYGLEGFASAAGRPEPPALVLELVDGLRLDEHTAAFPVGGGGVARVRQSLLMARQIADALDAAHERGVIHRDLKPANVKVTPEGVVKVLDFGLAKAAGPAFTGADLSNSPTVTAAGTEQGLILGTAAYMSPEQARGTPLDKRTDIWSFGCVLFEMLSGRRAFTGETASDLIAAILHHEPDYSLLPAATPPVARRLLKRCFEKDPRQRLRDIADARADIDEALSDPPAANNVPGEVPAAHRRTMSPIGLALGAPAVLALGAGLGWALTRSSSVEPLPAYDHIVRIVSTAAHENSPAISPDGKWIAYLSNARGPTDVWVKSIAGGDPANLTAASGVNVQATDYVGGLAISPDGTQIAFAVTDPKRTLAGSWVIPAPIGGVPRRLLGDSHFGLQWSPDGRRIVFVRGGGPLGDALVVADPDGLNETIVARRQGAQHTHWPRWSADGRFIYFNHGPQNFNIEPTEVYRVPATGGVIEPVVTTARRAAFPFLDPQGRGLIYAANPDAVDSSLWWRDLGTGRETRLTAGIGEYTQPSLSADGKRLVGAIIDVRQALDRVTLTTGTPAALQPVTDGYSGDIDPSWSPDGARLVFSSSRTGNRTLWSSLDGVSKLSPLTSGVAIDERPAYSPDGRQIAFVSGRGGRRGIWMVGADGGTPRLVGVADVVDTISWSPDGRRLAYSTPIGDAPGLMIMDVATGGVTRVPTPAAATGPSWSRDDVIAFVEPRGTNLGAYAQLIRPDGQPVASSRLDGPDAPLINNGAVTWSPDGNRIAAASMPGAGAGSLWLIDPAARVPYTKLMDLPTGVFIRGLSWAPDGRSLIVGRYQSSGDIFLAERNDAR